MEAHDLHAFIIPNTDPHLSEYTAPHWKCRSWLSGFTGSAGTVVVTRTKAGLWTDSRYFLQAAEQLEGSGIDLFRDGLPETITLTDWICQELKPGEQVGLDGHLFSVDDIDRLKSQLESCHIGMDTTLDPFDSLWTNRPPMPQAHARIHPLAYAGRSAHEKITQIRASLQQNGAEGLLVSSLDEIAWTLNLRGSDIRCNPLVISYLLITQEQVFYFIAPEKVTPEVDTYLQEQGVTRLPYRSLTDFLHAYKGSSLQLTPSATNYAAFSAIAPTCRIVREASPVSLLKAVKNEQEIAGIHTAMVRDGVAMVRFLRWLEQAVPAGGETEMSIDRKLHEFRAQQALHQGESFDTIAGYKEHAAIVHYSAVPETDAPLRPEGFLLLDSGAQYLDATTDITRTIALGPLTDEEKHDYTAVLRGHIELALCRFPQGTRGCQLDVLARLALWKEGMNYLHGTGHGVGSYLSVHEGPQSIRMNENPVALLPGMLTSNEPGLYKSGRHGIRIENLMLVRESEATEFGLFYEFETVTLCPIDKKGIVREMLTQEEADWLNQYHQTVYERLSPYLDEEERTWLRTQTEAV